MTSRYTMPTRCLQSFAHFVARSETAVVKKGWVIVLNREAQTMKITHTPHLQVVRSNDRQSTESFGEVSENRRPGDCIIALDFTGHRAEVIQRLHVMQAQVIGHVVL